MEDELKEIVVLIEHEDVEGARQRLNNVLVDHDVLSGLKSSDTRRHALCEVAMAIDAVLDFGEKVYKLGEIRKMLRHAHHPSGGPGPAACPPRCECVRAASP